MKKEAFVPKKPMKQFKITCICGLTMHKTAQSERHLRVIMNRNYPNLAFSDIEEV